MQANNYAIYLIAGNIQQAVLVFANKKAAEDYLTDSGLPAQRDATGALWVQLKESNNFGAPSDPAFARFYNNYNIINRNHVKAQVLPINP